MTIATLQPQKSNTWWLYLLEGFAGITLGLMLVTAPGATTVALVTFLGFYWLIMGILSLVRIFVDQSIPWIWSLVIGILGVLAGLFVLKHPLLAGLTVPTVFVFLLGVQGLVMGAFEIVRGFKGGGVAAFVLGAIYVLLGSLLLGSPFAAALVLPGVIGVLLLVQGVALILWAFRVRAMN